MVTEVGQGGIDLTKGVDVEKNMLRQQLEAATMTAQHYALVATHTIRLLGEEVLFGNDEIEELKEWVLLQRLEDDEKLHYRVVSVEEAGRLLEAEKARQEAEMTEEEFEASKAEEEETEDGDTGSEDSES
jgi:hypothetical protein